MRVVRTFKFNMPSRVGEFSRDSESPRAVCVYTGYILTPLLTCRLLRAVSCITASCTTTSWVAVNYATQPAILRSAELQPAPWPAELQAGELHTGERLLTIKTREGSPERWWPVAATISLSTCHLSGRPLVRPVIELFCLALLFGSSVQLFCSALLLNSSLLSWTAGVLSFFDHSRAFLWFLFRPNLNT